jgi:hypothetical protein
MTKRQTIKHEFVEFIPAELDEGVLYISIPYATTTHLCACGCGNKVVLPLHSTHWKLTFDGETVSMSPSVGNWSFPCQSHYWIKDDRVEWAKQWSKEQIAGGRAGDQVRRERYLESNRAQRVPDALAVEPQGRVAWLLRRLRLRR